MIHQLTDSFKLAPFELTQILFSEAEDRPGFCVTVLPPQEVGRDRCFDNCLFARGYARLLKFGLGWLLVDHVGQRIKKATNG